MDDTGAQNAKRETGLFSIFNRFVYVCDAHVYALKRQNTQVLVRLKVLHDSVRCSMHNLADIHFFFFRYWLKGLVCRIEIEKVGIDHSAFETFIRFV